MKEIESYYIPVKIETEGNKIEHWTKKFARRKKIKTAIKYCLAISKIRPPCVVLLSRVAPRFLDKEDNLRSALKWAKDAVAEKLNPGLAPGRVDEDERITWEFSQEKGKVREYALKIDIWRKDDGNE